jgi:hypothetical protein
MVRRLGDRNVSWYLLIITTFTLDAAQKSGEAGNLKRDKGFAPMNIAKNARTAKNCQDLKIGFLWL